MNYEIINPLYIFYDQQGFYFWGQQHSEQRRPPVRTCDSNVLDFKVISLSQTWSHIHPFSSTRGPQSYNWGQFVEKPLKRMLPN
jgi:hypothetical protein